MLHRVEPVLAPVRLRVHQLCSQVACRPVAKIAGASNVTAAALRPMESHAADHFAVSTALRYYPENSTRHYLPCSASQSSTIIVCKRIFAHFLVHPNKRSYRNLHMQNRVRLAGAISPCRLVFPRFGGRTREARLPLHRIVNVLTLPACLRPEQRCLVTRGLSCHILPNSRRGNSTRLPLKTRFSLIVAE